MTFLVDLYFKQSESIFIQQDIGKLSKQKVQKKLTVDEQNALSEDQKHTSFVAKVHYKKLQSRHVAERGKEAMDKLRDESASISTLETITNSLSLSDSLNNVDVNSELKVDFNTSTKKKIAFSSLEDKFLRAAIAKYKGGKWTSILADAEYKFHPSRRPSTIFARAKKLKLI